MSLERLTALCDGIFAFAMTLLALNLAVPASPTIRTEHDLPTALDNISPHVVTYLMSFMTLVLVQLNYVFAPRISPLSRL